MRWDNEAEWRCVNVQTPDKNRDPRHINRCQLPWMANKRKQFSIRKIYKVFGRRRRLQKARGSSRGVAGGAHKLAPASRLSAGPMSPWAGIAVPEAVPVHTGCPSIPAWGQLEGQSLKPPRGRRRGQWQHPGAVPWVNHLLLALSFSCVSPSVLFQAQELPFNSSRKQLRNVCFF